MTAASTLQVALGDRAYDILVGENLLAGAGERIKAVVRRPDVAIVTDENVAPLYLERLQASLDEAGVRHSAVVLPAGEGTKDFNHLSYLVEGLLERRVERRTTLIALGGGVIGDITGFAAAILLRGVDFVQVPTTLLAQVDSSVGGKTGINSRHGKNLIGAFHQPRLVLADMDVLDTLPRRELLAGYAEVAKYGLIDDPSFFAWLEGNVGALVTGDKAVCRKAVLTSCAAKAKVVAADEREGGVRALLNLGHTFGHALEAETGYGERLLHGESVALGMVMAFDLSARLGLCPPEDAGRVRRHLSGVGLPVDVKGLQDASWTAERLMAHMQSDKKVKDGRVTFILARGIGKSFIAEDVDPARVRDLLADYLAGGGT
ncbi:MAG: 3-dehydroquinate synthase [Magnetospirillum sp. WYHS-4]